MLSLACELLPTLTKAQKWIKVKGDIDYSFLWIMRCLDSMASIEVVWRNEIPSREVILQAIALNPDLFAPLYSGLIHGEKTRDVIETAVQTIEDYVVERVPTLFRSLLDYLAEAGGVRSTTEIDHYFSTHYGLFGAASTCEWLADMRLIDRVSVPVRLAERSRVDFDEAAYYYEPN